ncbi:MAG: hypothetical protein WC683_20225 [bacterium]
MAERAKNSNRGSKPGERRGGRQKGSPNKATAEIREIARQYAPDAVQELARLSREAQSEQARVAAIKEILDRAYGKSTQPIAGDGDGGPVQLVVMTGVPRGD